MSAAELPPGWKVYRFSEIAESITERVDDPSTAGVDRYVGLEHLDPDSTVIRRWGSPEDVGSTKLRFYPGDVVYGRRRAYQRKLGVADFDGICSAHALVLRARPEVCIPEFLPYFLQSDSFHSRALDISVGSLSPTINWRTLAVQEFALPPIDDQRTIAEALAEFEDVAAKYQRTYEAANQLREAELARVAEHGGSRLVPLDDLADVVSGESWKGSDESSLPADGSVPVIGISSLKPNGEIEYTTPTYVAGLARKTNLFRVDANTVVVIRTNGNSERIGNAYRGSDAIIGCALSAFTFGCRFETSEQADLAFEYMSGRGFQRWATSLVAGSTGLKNLPIRQLRTALVPPIHGPDGLRTLDRLKAIRSVLKASTDSIERTQIALRTLRENLLGGLHVVQ
jgi:hypothetical protein